jgi:hypothetical protein
MENEKMKKKSVILLSILVVIVTFVIMFTREYPQAVSLDETIIDVTQLEEYKGSAISWISLGKKYHPQGYEELSAVMEGWSLDGSFDPIPRLFQCTLLYKNEIRAGLAFYLYAPDRVNKDNWPNYYSSSSNQTKEFEMELNADKYRVYCGMGSKDACQTWYYWAQYDNYIVEFGLFDVRGGNSIEEFGRFISELDAHLSDLILVRSGN